MFGHNTLKANYLRRKGQRQKLSDCMRGDWQGPTADSATHTARAGNVSDLSNHQSVGTPACPPKTPRRSNHLPSSRTGKIVCDQNRMNTHSHRVSPDVPKACCSSGTYKISSSSPISHTIATLSHRLASGRCSTCWCSERNA